MAEDLNETGVEKPTVWGGIQLKIIVLMLSGLVLFFVALYIQDAVPKKYEMWTHGAEELGLSLVEAGLVMLLIEQRSSREQVTRSLRLIKDATDGTTRQVNASTAATEILIAKSVDQAAQQTQKAIENLFDSVYKQNVPKPLVRLYEETAFKSPFFRTDYEYTCKFDEPASVSPNMIRATFYQTFVMNNLTDSEKTFELACETELPGSVAPAARPQHCDYTLLNVDGVPVLTPEKVTQIGRDGYHALLLSHSEKIPGGGAKRFEIGFKNLRFRRDFEVVMMNWPADGIVFRLTYPATLEVALIALHPNDLESVPTADDSMQWRLKSGFMSGQGVCLMWKEKV